MKEELDTLCAAGKISRQESARRHEGALKEVLKRRQAEQEETRANAYRQSLMKRKKELDAAVEAGRISEDMELCERAEKVIEESKKKAAKIKQDVEKAKAH